MNEWLLLLLISTAICAIGTAISVVLGWREHQRTKKPIDWYMNG